MSDASTATSAGRGFVWLTAAKLVFMLAGWTIHFALPHLVGDVQFGRYVVVVGLASIANNVLVSSAIQGVSRFVASAPGAAAAVLGRGLLGFGGAGLLLAGLLVVLAPALAAAEADPALAALYRLAAPIALGYALYAVTIGVLNGRRRFGLQAGFDAGYAALRLAAILGLAALAGTAAGGLGGYSAAALVIAVVGVSVALVIVRRDATAGAAGPAPSLATLAAFALPVAAQQLGLNLLLRTDLLLVKGYAGSGAASQAAADAASVVAAHYGVAQLFAFVPYQALVALVLLVFPLVAAAHATGDQGRLHATVGAALRYAILFGAGAAAALAAHPADLVQVVYRASYAPAGEALRYLAWGVVGLSVIALGTAVLNAAGRTRTALLLTVVPWVLQAGLVMVALGLADGPATMRGAAARASAVALLAGGALTLAVLHRSLGVAWPLATLVRAALAAGIATGVGMAVPARGGPAALAVAALVLALYAGLLVALRELTRTDLAAVQGLLRRP
jgi:stage V sporulation protein B